MNLYFVPFSAKKPEDIIVYRLSEKEKETLAFTEKGQVSFEYKKIFHRLPGGRWARTPMEALEIMKFYLLEEKKEIEERIKMVDEERLKLI